MLVFHIVKGLPRLALVHATAIIGLLIIGTLAFFVRDLVRATVSYPRMQFDAVRTFMSIMEPGLIAAVLGSTLISLIYAMRKRFRRLWVLPAVFIMSTVSLAGVAVLAQRLAENFPPISAIKSEPTPASPMDRNGLVRRASDGSMVMLWPKSMIWLPDGATAFTMTVAAATSLNLPLVYENPFEPSLDLPAFLVDLAEDLRLVSRMVSSSVAQGLLPACAAAAALVALFLAMHPLADLTRWPLANTVLCAAISRLMLSGLLIVTIGPIKRSVAALPFILPEYVESAYVGAIALAFLIVGSIYPALRPKKRDDD